MQFFQTISRYLGLVKLMKRSEISICMITAKNAWASYDLGILRITRRCHTFLIIKGAST